MMKKSSDSAAQGWYLGMSMRYAQKEKQTPWLGADTANHYQWYPFINVGHYELAKQLKGNKKDLVIGLYGTVD